MRMPIYLGTCMGSQLWILYTTYISLTEWREAESSRTLNETTEQVNR